MNSWETRLAEIRKIHIDYSAFYKISGGVTLIVIGLWVGSLLFTDGYATNVYTEVLSVAATIVVLDQINQWRDREALKKKLLREAKGQSNETAKASIDWMRDEGWLEVTHHLRLLHNVDLSHANLHGANLTKADLSYSKLVWTNLQWAKLQYADLRSVNLINGLMIGTYLSNADIAHAQLINIRFERCKLWAVNFEQCKLENVELTLTDLTNANLRNAELSGVIFDTYTILPDSNSWLPTTDMTRYTDPNHPNFWEPEYLKQNWHGQTFAPDPVPDWVKSIRKERFGEI